MKQFSKTLPKRHPLSIEVRDLYGAEGFTYLTDLLELVQEIGEFELTPKIVSRECGINAQKVARIFENLKRIFEESCKYLGLSSNKVERNFKESSNKVPTFDTQNPHGSTRDLEENRIEENTPPTPTEPESVCDEFYDFSQECLKTAIASGNPNIQNWSWVSGYLKTQAQTLKQEKPDLPVSEMLRIWQNCCVLASSKTVSSARWYQSVFESETAKWHPKAKGVPPAAVAPKKSRLELLQEAISQGKAFRDKITGQVIQADRLQLKTVMGTTVFVLLDDPTQTREPGMLEVVP